MSLRLSDFSHFMRELELCDYLRIPLHLTTDKNGFWTKKSLKVHKKLTFATHIKAYYYLYKKYPRTFPALDTRRHSVYNDVKELRIMSGMRFTIRSKADLIKAINKYGFLPFFRNSIEGFSIEEHIAPECWYFSDSGRWDAWEWKGSIIQKTGCAYGKFFEHKAVYISKEWFPDFANYRRDGYDFDARYEDGLARHIDKVLYDLLDSNASIISKELKKLGDYRKGGNKGFDTAVTRLQEQCYVIISNFVYMTDKHGQPYGWGVAEYSTPEKFMGAAFTDKVYQREPEESYQIVFEHLRKILPQASAEQIGKLLK